MSNNYIAIDYSEITFPRSSIKSEELKVLQRLNANVQDKIKRHKDYIYEANNLMKHLDWINKEWLQLSILLFEDEIRKLESLYR